MRTGLFVAAIAAIVLGIGAFTANRAVGFIQVTPYEADVNKSGAVNVIDLQAVAQKVGQLAPMPTPSATPISVQRARMSLIGPGNYVTVVDTTTGQTVFEGGGNVLAWSCTGEEFAWLRSTPSGSFFEVVDATSGIVQLSVPNIGMGPTQFSCPLAEAGLDVGGAMPVPHRVVTSAGGVIFVFNSATGELLYSGGATPNDYGFVFTIGCANDAVAFRDGGSWQLVGLSDGAIRATIPSANDEGHFLPRPCTGGPPLPGVFG